MRESDILYTAIDNLKKETGANIEVTKGLFVNGHKWDALLNININGIQRKFKVEIKNKVHQANMSTILELLKDEGILIAQYISQPGKNLLEQHGINYLDIAGNCFIKSEDGLFWKINNLRATNIQEINKHRGFHKNGIKLILALLLNNKLINQPYRVQAQVADISVSTIGGIHKDLIESRFLYQLNKNEKQLVNKEELFSQWVATYNQKLKPKLFRGRFRMLNMTAQKWHEVNIENYAFWGGEPAADALTNTLQPEILTLYTNLDRRQLISDLNLVPDLNGQVEVYSLFWKSSNNKMVNFDNNTVHPGLVYADLLSSNDNRNFETAKKIYERYLKDIFK